jgi:hypothetical protein
MVEALRCDQLLGGFARVAKLNPTQRHFARRHTDLILCEWLSRNCPSFPRDPIPMTVMARAVLAGFLSAVAWALSTYDNPMIYCADHDQILFAPEWEPALVAAVVKLEISGAARKEPWDDALGWLLIPGNDLRETELVRAAKKATSRLSTATKTHLRSLREPRKK